MILKTQRAEKPKTKAKSMKSIQRAKDIMDDHMSYWKSLEREDKYSRMLHKPVSKVAIAKAKLAEEAERKAESKERLAHKDNKLSMMNKLSSKISKPIETKEEAEALFPYYDFDYDFYNHEDDEDEEDDEDYGLDDASWMMDSHYSSNATEEKISREFLPTAMPIKAEDIQEVQLTNKGELMNTRVKAPLMPLVEEVEEEAPVEEEEVEPTDIEVDTEAEKSTLIPAKPSNFMRKDKFAGGINSKKNLDKFSKQQIQKKAPVLEAPLKVGGIRLRKPTY